MNEIILGSLFYIHYIGMSISIVPESYIDIISKRIAPLFGTTPEETKKFIINLQTKDTDRLRDFYDLLPMIEFESKRRSRASEGKPLHTSIVNGPSTLSIYKKIDISTKSNFLNAMTEAFIQSVLSTDPDIGSSIGKVLDICRSGGYLLIHMERLSTTLSESIRILSQDTILDISKEYLALIRRLQRDYKFQHSDIHLVNIMLNDENHVKLIDFGNAQIELDGQLFKTSVSKKLSTNYNIKSLFNTISNGNLKTRLKPVKFNGSQNNNIRNILNSFKTRKNKRNNE